MIESPFIRLYPGIASADVCRRLISAFVADPRKRPGRAYGSAQAKRSIDLGLRGLPEWTTLCDELDAIVVRALRKYSEDVPNFRDIHRDVRDTGYLLQSYLPDGQHQFDWHADSVSRESADRILAMILYLNDVEVGGETEFRSQQRSIAPREGSILWFPPGFEYVHRGKPPLSGTKYIITTFLVYP